jgi:alpha-beta hydrolase superfamily lysophospholipase
MNWKRLLIGEWNWKRPLKSIAFIYGVLAIIALFFSNLLIFQPPPAQYTSNASRLEMLADETGRDVAAFWYPPSSADDPILLWSHGNAEDIGALVPLHRELAKEGFGILAYDYPGYGLSSGSPGEAGCYTSIEAAYAHLINEKRIPASRIFVVGQSVGSGPACWLAEREDTAGLILISPFLSAFRTATKVPLFPGDKFPNLHRIKNIEEPLLVIHGTADATIPFEHGERLHHLHSGTKALLPISNANHNTIWPVGYPEITSALLEFTNR